MDNQSETVRSRICTAHPAAIARHYSRDDVPHEAARAAANHRHDAALARVRAATRVLISDTAVDAGAYPGVATVVYAGCVPHLPLVLPPKPAEKRAAPATRFFSLAHGEPTAWTWAADVAERPTRHVGPDLAPVQLLNRLLRGFLRRAEEMRDTKKTGTDYSLGWIHVIVEGAMRDDVMLMLLLLSADESRARVALSDDECLFIPHLVGGAKACTSIVYRSMYIDGCAEIRYLDPVRIELEFDSSGFGDIESADVEKSDSIVALAGLIKNVTQNTRGNFSVGSADSKVTVGVAQHPGATYSPADVFLCDAAAIRPLRIADTQKGSAHTVPTVNPGEIYAGLFDATGVLRRFYAMAYYASYLSGSARKSLRTLAAVLETNGVRVEPAVVPPLPHFAPAAPRFEPIVDAYGSDGKEKIRNGAVAVRMVDLPPPIAFSADGVVRYCYPVCRLGRYTDSSDFAYAALRRGKIASRVARKTADDKADADGADDSDNVKTADDGDDDDTDDGSDVFVEALAESIETTIARANNAVEKAREAVNSASTHRSEFLGLRSKLRELEASATPYVSSAGPPSIKKTYEEWADTKSKAEKTIERGLSGIEITKKAAKATNDARGRLARATKDTGDITVVPQLMIATESSAKEATDAAWGVYSDTFISQQLVDFLFKKSTDLIVISEAVAEAASYVQTAEEYMRESKKKLSEVDSVLADANKYIEELKAKKQTAQTESVLAQQKTESAKQEENDANSTAVAAMQTAAAAEAKMNAMSSAEIGSQELPVDIEDAESFEYVKAAADAANSESEKAQAKAAAAASDAVTFQEQSLDATKTKEAVDAALAILEQTNEGGKRLVEACKVHIKGIEDAFSSMKDIVYAIENDATSNNSAQNSLDSIKNNLMDTIVDEDKKAASECNAYVIEKESAYEKIDWERIGLIHPDTVNVFSAVAVKIATDAFEAAAKKLSALRIEAENARKAAMQENADDAAAAEKTRQDAALTPLLPAVQYSDRFFAWGHRYACVVLSALPGAPLPLPRIAAHYLYLRTICAARDLVSPDEVRQLHAAFGKATHHPEHAMREFDRLAATHTAIQVAYEGILAPLLIRTVVDPRVSRCVRVRAGDKYGSDYAPYIGLFEFGPTAEPSTSDWPGRKVRIRLSREPAAGTRLDEMVSLLLLDANPDVKWEEPDTVFAAIRAHHTLLRDADWFLPIADGMRAGLSKTVVGTWRLRLHFAIQADAEAYATGLVGRLKTRSDYIAAGAESVTLLLGGQAVGVAITMDPVVRGTRAE